MRRSLGAFIGAIGLSVAVPGAVSGCGGGSATGSAHTKPDPATANPPSAKDQTPVRAEPTPPPLPPPPAKLYTPKYARKPARVSASPLPRSTHRPRTRSPRIYAGLDDLLREARPLVRVGTTELADKEAELKRHLADKKKTGRKAKREKRRGKHRKAKDEPKKKDQPPAVGRPRPRPRPLPAPVTRPARKLQLPAWEDKRISLVHDLASIRLRAFRWGRVEEGKLLGRIRTTHSYYTRLRLQKELTKKTEETKKLQAEAELAGKKLMAEKKLAKYSRYDEALFDRGLLFHLSGQPEKAQPVWKRLLDKVADSRFAPVVRLVVAEQAFDKNAMAEAERLYEEASKNAPRYGFVPAYLAYKQGWVQHRLNRHDKAMKSFQDAYRYARYRRQLNELREGAMRGFVRAFAASGDADKAYLAFYRLDYRRAFEMVQLLSDVYRSQGKAKEVLALAREMLRRQSDHVLACSWQLEVALDAIRSGDRKAQRAALDAWIKVYVSQRDRYGLIPPTEVSDCHNAAQRIATSLARSMHLDAQKSGKDEDFAATAAMYGTYLSIWPKAADAAEIRYYRADLRWRAAARPTPVDQAIERWTHLTRAYDDLVTRGSYTVRYRAKSAGAIAHANLAAIYADPTLGKSNKKLALDHYRKACDYRHTPSCEEADRIRGKKKASPPPPIP